MIIFSILMVIVVANLIGFAIKLGWGVFKVVISIILLPLTFLLLALKGLLYLAIPALAIYGMVMLAKSVNE